MCKILVFFAQVKNRAPAKIQITAEQLILESTARQDDKAFEPPKQLITDPQVLFKLPFHFFCTFNLF